MRVLADEVVGKAKERLGTNQSALWKVVEFFVLNECVYVRRERYINHRIPLVYLRIASWPLGQAKVTKD